MRDNTKLIEPFVRPNSSPSNTRRDRHVHRSTHIGAVALFVALLASLATALLAGCDGKTSAEKLRDAGFDPASRAVSFDAIADRLNNLDQAVRAHDEANEPAEVVVDATRSTDSQPVLGVVTDGPQRSGTFEFLHVPQGNVNFSTLGVLPGDTIEYLIELPKAANIAELEFFKKARLDGRKSIQRYVAKVVDAHTLLLDAPLPPLSPDESYPLVPIVVTRPNRERVDHLDRAIAQWESTGQPAVDWEATPDRDALDVLLVQLNNWSQRDDTAFDWHAEPLLATLPPPLQPHFGRLDAERFVRSDARLLQEAVWLRDIARRADGKSNPLDKAKQLFGWIVDNIQLDANQAALGIRQRPWQALASGRATADERAWLFILLLRQLNIDAVALTIPPADGDAQPRSEGVWTVAVQIGETWRLFDPTLGLPLIGPDGDSVATLAQAKSDDAELGQSVLRQLDLDESRPYPYNAEQARRAVALLEATPLYLSRRARRIELQLAGANRIVLSTSPSRIADAIRPHVASVALWPIGIETAAARSTLSPAARSVLAEQFRVFARVPALWKGRALQFRDDDHQSEFDYADRPVRVYSLRRDPRWYFTQYCRKSDRDLAAASAARFPIASLRMAKHFAAVWMGCLAYEDGDFAEALAYFGERTLERESDKLLRPLARQGLARTHERIAQLLDELARRPTPDDPALDDSVSDESMPDDLALDDENRPLPDETIAWLPTPRQWLSLALTTAAAEQRATAVELYEADNSLQQHGSLIRARRLRMSSTDL